MGMTRSADFPQHLGVVYHCARTQQVLTIGLASPECPEVRGIDNLSQTFIMDIIRSHMDKDAGFCITVRINMEKVASASNTTTHVRGIVPEVNGEDWLLITDTLWPTHSQQLPLLSGGHQTGISIGPYRDVEKVPTNEAAFFN